MAPAPDKRLARGVLPGSAQDAGGTLKARQLRSADDFGSGRSVLDAGGHRPEGGGLPVQSAVLRLPGRHVHRGLVAGSGGCFLLSIHLATKTGGVAAGEGACAVGAARGGFPQPAHARARAQYGYWTAGGANGGSVGVESITGWGSWCTGSRCVAADGGDGHHPARRLRRGADELRGDRSGSFLGRRRRLR